MPICDVTAEKLVGFASRRREKENPSTVNRKVTTTNHQEPQQQEHDILEKQTRPSRLIDLDYY
ncbi:hypothetical protein PGTUg99_004200 [Puccinia graminis f. sp. tritici]|uniref:Uncharacterized protein n=1 Tax=Puccinia graminis f. sp. tritici TaxID=56615 RepID=A0A5B0Q0V7_PUCGR|nr:hypothetical protein PGTUg99_004200 [Puccinia graminis f. sp. tritici]